jgi:hypothetical protein
MKGRAQSEIFIDDRPFFSEAAHSIFRIPNKSAKRTTLKKIKCMLRITRHEGMKIMKNNSYLTKKD